MANAHDLLMVQRAAMMGGKLPYLRRVAYLESSGVQYIDTGIVIDDSCEVSCTFEYKLLDSNYRTPMSIRSYDGSDDSFTIFARTTNATTGGWGRRYPCTTVNVHANEKVGYRIKKNEIVCNGVSGFSDSFGRIEPSGLTVYIFGRNSGGSFSNAFVGRIYDLSVLKNGSEIIDLIPVIDISGRPCMYNQAPSAVSSDDPSRFFYNASGVGEFTWGELDAA